MTSRIILVPLALILLLAPLARCLGAGDSPPTRPTTTESSEKTSQRLDSLEVRQKELGDTVDRAALKTDYIEKIQKQYETYYEKAFSTQIQLLTILGIFLTVVLFLGGKFGLRLFDRQIQLELKSATDGLRLEFQSVMDERLRSLSEKNRAQLKELEEGLKTRIAVLEEDLQLRSDFQFHFFMGMSAFLDGEFIDAVGRYHRALEVYLKGKERKTIARPAALTAIDFIFTSIQKLTGSSEEGMAEFVRQAKEELENKIYEQLAEELAEVGERHPELKRLREG
jgi:hypothetical protein